MNRLGRLLLPVIMAGVVFVLSGCAAHNPFFKKVENLPADKAVIYIYHTGGSRSLLFPIAILANDKDVTAMKKGTYYAYVTNPGAIEFTARYMGASSRVIDANAGQSYYLKVSIPRGLSLPPSLELVSPEAGEKEIANCKLIPEK